MEPSAVYKFILFIALVQIVVDSYVNATWGRFVRKRGWNGLFSTFAWVASAIIFCVGLFSTYRRLSSDGLSDYDMILQHLVWLWYAPKLPIAVVLLIKDIIRLIIWVWRKIRTALESEDSFAKQKQTPIATSVARRDFLQKTGWALAGAPFGIVANGMFGTLYDFQIKNVELRIVGLPSALEGLRITQISDIHAGSFISTSPMREAGRLIREQRTDLIVVTGDFVNFHPSELPTVYRELELLKAPLGVYGILGNHDHFMSLKQHVELKTAIKKTAIDLLVNENRIIQIDGAGLAIAGTDNTGFNQYFAKLGHALSGIEPDITTILLAHDPTFWDKEVRGKNHADIMLSGHTHGGQVAFAVPGLTLSPAQIVYKQWAGLYGDKNQLLYVNCGLGTVGPPLRIGIPPEITILTLTRG